MGRSISTEITPTKMHKFVRVVAFLSIALGSSVRADEFKIHGIALDIPSRFEGPVSTQSDANARTHVFTVRNASSILPSTVLQITAFDVAAAPERQGGTAISQRYLLQMLQGIEHRRTEYRQFNMQEIRLAGFLGSVASWQGKANGIGTNGKMFCILTESELLFFHVMGGGSVPNADMEVAIKAVEHAHKY